MCAYFPPDKEYHVRLKKVKGLGNLFLESDRVKDKLRIDNIVETLYCLAVSSDESNGN